MGITTIEWTRGDDGTPGRTANPIRARHKVTGKVGWHCVMTSPGCARCYAQTLNGRFGTKLPFTQRSEQDVELFLDLKPMEALRRVRKPSRVFLCDMTDLFQEAVPDEWIDKLFDVMATMDQHTFQILTKRSRRMLEYFRSSRPSTTWHIPNIWLGVSVEDQKRADERIPHLLQVPAAVRFLSVEPMLEPIDLSLWRVAIPKHRESWPAERVTNFWVICGGESGPRSRPFDLAWARSLRDQCEAAGVPYFLKQLGSNCHGYWLDPNGKGDGICYHSDDDGWDLGDTKGGDMSKWPDDLRIREFPQSAKACAS